MAAPWIGLMKSDECAKYGSSDCDECGTERCERLKRKAYGSSKYWKDHRPSRRYS